MFSLDKYPLPPNQLPIYITADELHIGNVKLSRKNCCAYEDCNLLVLRDQKSALKSLMQCVKMNWMSILVCLLMVHKFIGFDRINLCSLNHNS